MFTNKNRFVLHKTENASASSYCLKFPYFSADENQNTRENESTPTPANACSPPTPPPPPFSVRSALNALTAAAAAAVVFRLWLLVSSFVCFFSKNKIKRIKHQNSPDFQNPLNVMYNQR